MVLVLVIVVHVDLGIGIGIGISIGLLASNLECRMPPSAIGHRDRDRAGCTECNNGTVTDADGGGVLKWREEKAFGERKYGGKRYGKWQSLLPHGWTMNHEESAVPIVVARKVK